MSAPTPIGAALERGIAGAGAALEALSEGRVVIDPPAIRELGPADLVADLGSPDRVVVGVYVGFDGPLSGHALLLMTPTGATRICRHLVDGAGLARPASATDPVLDDLGRSALEELGNIVISAVLNELGRGSDVAIHPSVPQIVEEMAGAILDSILADLLVDCDTVVVGRSTFVEAGDTFDGWLLVMPRRGERSGAFDTSPAAA